MAFLKLIDEVKIWRETLSQKQIMRVKCKINTRAINCACQPPPERIYNGALNCCGDKLQSANTVQRSTRARSPDKIRANNKRKCANEARPGAAK
jgi:hypothetical protein